MTIQTVAIAIAMTAQPTVTVVRIATKGTSESPEFDHLDPERIKNVTNIITMYLLCFNLLSNLII